MHLFYFISALLFSIGILNPFHIPPWNSFHSEFFCASAIVILFFIQAIKQKIYLNHKFILTAIIIYTFIFTLIILSENKYDYINLTLYITIYAIGFASGFNSKELKNEFIFKLFILIGLFLSASIFAQFFDVDEYFTIFPSIQNSRRPGGSLIQSNHAATFLCIGLICCLHAKFTTKILPFILFSILAFSLAVTESRTGIISFFIYAIYAIIKKYKSIKIFTISFLFIIMAYCIVPEIYDSYYINETKSSVRANIQGGRLNTWPILFKSIKDQPLTGYGFNNVFNALDIQLRENPDLQSEPFHYSHNLLIDLSIWFGIPLATIFTLFFTNLIIKTLRHSSEKIEVILVPIITHAMLEYPHAYFYFGITFLFILGKCQKPNYTTTTLIKKEYLLATLIAIISIIIIYVKLYINSEELIRSIRFNSIGINAIQKEERVLSYFKIDKNIFTILINKEISEEEIGILKYSAQHRPSKTYQKKYAESLYASQKCTEFLSQINVISAYYGLDYARRTKENIESKYRKFIECTH